IGPDPRNFNQRVSLGRNDLLIRTFPKDSFAHLKIRYVGGGLNIKNDSANWITIPELMGNKKINTETLMLAPWSDKTLNTTTIVNYYKVTLIDDHGNYLSENIKVDK
ncbi:hypothetical protein MRO53_24025, partial [Escherichia coli]|nr:hypothetical protein [Escherichia coli]